MAKPQAAPSNEMEQAQLPPEARGSVAATPGQARQWGTLPKGLKFSREQNKKAH